MPQQVTPAVIVQGARRDSTQTALRLALFNEDGSPFVFEPEALINVENVVLTGLEEVPIPAEPEAIDASDSLLEALQKLQGQIDALGALVTGG